MSGDFLAYLIHQDKKYFNVELSAPYMSSEIALECNRYLFPCLTENVLGYEIKMHGGIISANDASVLKHHYKDKSLVLPTHIYHSPTTDMIRWYKVYTDDTIAINKAFVNWWLKSHIHTTRPGNDRLLYISQIEDEYWRNELTERFNKCKFLAYKNGILVNSRFDLDFYINSQYKNYVSSSRLRNIPGYINIDINEILYKQRFKHLENMFGVSINPDIISEYVTKNEDKFLEHNIDPIRDNFKQQLCEVAKNVQSINITDYIKQVSR